MMPRIEVRPSVGRAPHPRMPPVPVPPPLPLTTAASEEEDGGIPIWHKMALTLDEAAALIGIGRSHLDGFIRQGDLPVVRLGKRTLVRPESLARFLVVHEH